MQYKFPALSLHHDCQPWLLDNDKMNNHVLFHHCPFPVAHAVFMPCSYQVPVSVPCHAIQCCGRWKEMGYQKRLSVHQSLAPSRECTFANSRNHASNNKSHRSPDYADEPLATPEAPLPLPTAPFITRGPEVKVALLMPSTYGTCDGGGFLGR